MRSRPLLISLALAAVRVVSVVVPRRDRTAWRQEWEAEILHRHGAFISDRERGNNNWSDQMTVTRRAFGSIVDAAWLRRQFTRDSELVHDIRHGFRVLRSRPAFSLLAILVLALGIGSTTAIFSVGDAMLLRDLPYPNPNELVAIWQRDTTSAQPRGEVAAGNFLDWRASATSFEAIASAEPYAMDHTGDGNPEVFFASRVSERFFDILRVKPLHGRLFDERDHRPGQDRVVVLGHGLWQRRFGSNPALVGRTVTLDEQPHVVIGVLPKEFELALLPAPGDRDLWLPKVFQEYEKNARGSGWWGVIGRLAPGVSLPQAQSEMEGVSARLARDFPRTNKTTVGFVEPLGEHLVGGVKPALLVMMAAVVAVLLIACANVANMMLVRGSEREQEFAVRGALGASRARLVRQLLAESALVALAGTTAGLLLAVWGLDVVVALAPKDVPRLEHVGLSARLLVIASMVGIVTAIGAGLAPALQFSRPRRTGTEAGTLDPARGSTGTRRARFVRDGLAVAEIALAVTLVAAAGLLVRSFVHVLGVDPGFRADHVLALQVFAWDRQNTPDKRRVFFEDTLGELKRLPGVVDAGAVVAMPLISANINIQGPIAIEGRPPAAPDASQLAFLNVATPGYFPVMGIPLMKGRGLSAADTATSEPVAVISAALAHKHWPDGNPPDAWISFRFSGQPRRVRVVGVVGDLRHDGLDLPPREEIFMPHAQLPYGSMTFVVRTANDPAALVEPAKRLIWSRDPLLTFYDATTVNALVAHSVAPRQFSLVLMAAFAAIALLLAAVGIYGVLSFATSQQTREFGVRLALGATGREIGWLVIGRGLKLGLVGLAFGLAGALTAGQLMRTLLFDTTPTDVATLAIVSVGVLAVATLACYLPARRAMRIDPVVALRQ